MRSGWPIWNRKVEVRGRGKQTQLLPFVPFPSQSLRVYSFSSRNVASSSCSDPAVPIGISDGAVWFLGLLWHSQHLCPPWGSWFCFLVSKTLFHPCSLPLKPGLGPPGRIPHCWCGAVFARLERGCLHVTVAKRATCCLHALVGKPRGLTDEGQALPLSSSFVEEQLEILRTHCD